MTCVAAMQPYILPYLPYFQLIGAVDCFVVLDDVQYIRRGWMNRNRILLDGEIHTFTFPVSRGQQTDRVADKRFSQNIDSDFSRLKRTFFHAYGGTANWSVLQQLLNETEARLKNGFLDVAEYTISSVCGILGQNTRLIRSSSLGIPGKLDGNRRILAICEALGADCYINLPGGRTLYKDSCFSARGINLRFLDGRHLAYAQYGAREFVPGLSVADFLANCSPADYACYLAPRLT